MVPGSAEFLKKLRATSDEKSLPQYLLTHPYSEDRVMKIEQLAKPMKTRVDDSLFPFIVARLTVVGRPSPGRMRRYGSTGPGKTRKTPSTPTVRLSSMR